MCIELRVVQLTLHRDNAIKRILLTDHTSQCATVFLFILPAIASPGGTLTLGDLNVNVKIIYSVASLPLRILCIRVVVGRACLLRF